jgi:hypothetical protein
MSRLAARRPHRKALGAGMALYLLSPVVAELCSGATPAFNYIFFGWMLCLMYGGGAILIREFTLRWGKGWPTILVLGVAYGLAEEGIAVRTFFDATAPVEQPLAGFGWVGGVSWVFTTHLLLYHAVISIAIPIFLVMLAYPARRNEPWVSSRWLKKAAVGYVGVHIFWLLVYQRPVAGGYIVASLVVIAGLILLARRLPTAIALPGRLGRHAGIGRAPTPKRIAIVAFSSTFAVFWMDWGKGLGLPADGAVAVMVLVATVTGWWLVRGSQRPGWTDRQRFAVAAGIVFFLVVFSPFIELSGARGTLIVGIVTGWLFVRQWRRLREREAASQPTLGGSDHAGGAVTALPAPAPGP